MLQDSNVIAFSIPEFEQVVTQNTRIILKMLKVFSNQLRRIHKRVQNLLYSEVAVKPETGDNFVFLGQLEHLGDHAKLDAQLDSSHSADFTIDLVAITETGQSLTTGGVLFASPSLFQRLYYSEQLEYC